MYNDPHSVYTVEEVRVCSEGHTHTTHIGTYSLEMAQAVINRRMAQDPQCALLMTQKSEIDRFSNQG